MTASVIGSVILWLIVAIIVITVGVYLLSWLYHRSTKQIAFVRTGFGGETVVINGGALVLPIVHDVTPVNLNVVRIPVSRTKEAAVITSDRMRVDIEAEFFVRVIQQREAVAAAASTLGRRTMEPDQLGELLSGKFIGALRSVAAEMTLDEMHEARAGLVAKVANRALEALAKNGLELESVAITNLDQTNLEYFNPANRFDAEGMTQLIETIEVRRKLRNDIEQSSMVAIRARNLEAEKETLKLEQESENSRLNQARALEAARAEQKAAIERARTTGEAETEQAKIASDRETREHEIARRRALEESEIKAQEALERARIEQEKNLDKARVERERLLRAQQTAQRQSIEEAEISAREEVEKARIASDRTLDEVRILKERDLKQLEIERTKALELAEIERHIALLQKQTEEAESRIVTEEIRARAVSAEENVATTRETVIAERIAAVDRLMAEKDAETAKIAAESDRITAAVAAEAQRLHNEAENILTEDARSSILRAKLIDRLEGIVRETVRPLKKIDSIKVLHIDGLTGDGNSHRSPTDEVIESALRYRVQAPLIDELMKEVGVESANTSKVGDIFRAAKDVQSISKESESPEKKES